MSELLDLLAPGSRTDADGMLIIGDCRADDLANEFGTPLLVVAEEALRARAREYVAELTSRVLHFRAGSRNGLDTYEGEEDDSCRGHDSLDSKRCKICEIVGVPAKEGRRNDRHGGLAVDTPGPTSRPRLRNISTYGRKRSHLGRHEHIGLVKDEQVS